MFIDYALNVSYSKYYVTEREFSQVPPTKSSAELLA